MEKRFGLPISLDVAGRRCLILGGGFEATDKARRLVRAGAAVQVIADTVEPEVEAMAEGGEVGWACRSWTPADLRGAYLVYVTPDEQERADEAHQLALANGALICAIDKPEHCQFANPAVVEVGDLRLALSSGGRAPALLRRMREDLERALCNDRVKSFVEAMGAMRDRLPPGQRNALREAAAGFRLEIKVTLPDWFEQETDPPPDEA